MATEPLISDYLVPPGHYVREALDAKYMTQGELAERMGRPSQAVSEIINAKKEITEETAFELEAVLGVPAHVWLSLEGTYRYGLQAKKRAGQLAEQAEAVSQFPYQELVKKGAVAATRNPGKRAAELCRFFNIAKLSAVRDAYGAAFRKAPGKESNPFALAAWLRLGEIQAESIELPPFDKERAAASLSLLRAAALNSENVEQAVREIIHPCGIAFAVIPHLPKTYVCGAVFWHRTHPVILLSIRGVYEDIFWFTLFHEIGHILLHGRSAVIVEGLEESAQREAEADEFAQDSLIPPDQWQRFTAAKDFSREAVIRFADEQNISPAIPAGRLLRESSTWGRRPDLQSLRRKVGL